MASAPMIEITKENYASLTLYECLGIESVEALSRVDDKELQRRFRRRSLLVHPDKDPSPEAREAFEKLKLAAETLTDAKKRSDYLRSLSFQNSGGADVSEAVLRAHEEAQATVRAATDALHAREQAYVAKLAAIRSAETRRRNAAASMISDLVTSSSSYRDLEDQVVEEWDVDAAMVKRKAREVAQLLASLATGKRDREDLP
jgi:curved DNA-binding protein CbpA